MPTQTVEKERNMKKAPMPQMAAFVKVPVGVTVSGVMKQATLEQEKIKGKKGKEVTKERYHFILTLDKEVTLLTGPKKSTKETLFDAGSDVTLPEHGFLLSALRRIACEIKGVPYDADADTDLTALVGVYFEITREDDKEITKGEFTGTASAIYDVQYEAK